MNPREHAGGSFGVDVFKRSLGSKTLWKIAMVAVGRFVGSPNLEDLEMLETSKKTQNSVYILWKHTPTPFKCVQTARKTTLEATSLGIH